MSWNAPLRIPGHFLGMIRGFYNLIGDRVSLNLTKGHVALFVWGGSISQLFIFLVSLLLNLAHQHFLPQEPSGFHLFPSCSFSSFAGSDFFRLHVERTKVGQGWHVLFATTSVFPWRKSPLLCVVSSDLDRQLLGSKYHSFRALSGLHWHICGALLVTGAQQR